MAVSTSHVMKYSRRSNGGSDFVGGLPTHLPYTWPLCQLCQIPMAFVGQLYASDCFPVDHLAVQFYVCNDCRNQIHPASANGGINKKITLNIANTVHVQPIPSTAEPNKSNRGVRCQHQPKLYITYDTIDDSVDQRTFNRRKIAEERLPDQHLRKDKIGGLFPYDGHDGPKITKSNQLLAQFLWQGIGKTLYLYSATKTGLYPYLYW